MIGSYTLGLLCGWFSALILGGAAALVAFRRISRLQDRARHAERLAELGALTGGLAHEIKNPLSTLQLNLQLLHEDIVAELPNATRLTSRIATVQKEVNRLRDILDDFLRYAGRLEVDPKPADVNEVLEELVDFFTPQAQASRVILRLRRTEGPLVAPLDERLLKQSILNLMINAMQAMPVAGGELILSARREDRYAVIDVIDTGNGIPQESLDKIFQAYYSTKSGGTGLGLAVTRRIIQEHGGKIEVRSTVGEGTIFSIYLPM